MLKARIRLISIFAFLAVAAGACSSTRVLEGDRLEKSSLTADSVISAMPNYSRSLHTLKGKGKAIVSEPGNSERATIYFSSDRSISLVTIKNGIGIEGGQILARNDSLLIYNKVDNIARKISVTRDRISSINHLASVNIVDLINYTVSRESVESVYESETSYVLFTRRGGRIFVDKQDFTVLQVDQPRGTMLPYSRIIYEAYGQIEGYTIPRRLTIFSADSTSKVSLLVQSLEINPGNIELKIDLPEDVKFVR